QVRATLDQNAAPGSRRQRTDYGDWCGYDQRTRAGNDQQYQRSINTIDPGQARQQRPAQGHRYSHHEYRRRVITGETVNEALGGCTMDLGLFHRMNDARENRVVRGRTHLDLKASLQIDGACIY